MSGPVVETFYGRDGVHWTPYLSRIALASLGRLGDLSEHVFHRGDADPDPHDHPRAFVTLPLTAYVEHVFDPASGRESWRLVRAWRLHYRPAAFAHRVVGLWSGERSADARRRPVLSTRTGGIVTLVFWIGKAKRPWGFWVRRTDGFVGREWVGWRTYVYGEDSEGVSA